MKFQFQKQTQVSQVNKVLGVHASNTDGFLCRHTCVSSTQVNKTIWKKENLSPACKPKQQVVFLSETNALLTVKQGAISSCA
jgi:hypothetical protein